ncbi:pyridoxal phosphate-dependent aminotransferase [Planctellipticum variicoloris]|uniref:pyridoxal phosphate-dependent aminotransferase n=1 Tax=Planctellipticum variicoloris TaxID=3064265 RepID=UPI0030138363|nr:pyridoxal phosphate-dependent aminotransferase [Planctomycetaceae bacterium SH412]
MSAYRLSAAVQTLKPSATLAAAAKAKELKSKGVTVYDFTLGEPDFITPAHIRQAAVAAMEAGQTHYTPSGGIPELKKAVCGLYKRDYSLDFTPAQVLISNGAKHSIHNVIASLCGPGDEVIIPAPYWVSYSALVELTGATAVIVETTEASGFVMSPEQFRAAITPKTRLLMLNNPSNPTGAAYTAAQLEALARVAVENNVLVLSDEIYEKLVYAGAEFRSFASFGPDVAALTIIVSGVSKAYAMTGWRIGWTIGPVEIIKAMDNLQSQETSNPCSISQYASVAALEGPQTSVEEMRQEFERRRNYVMGRMRPWRERFGVTFAEPGGAFYAFFNVSSAFGKPLQGGKVVTNATDFCTALLEEAHVALVTGDAFGAPGYVRLSFATSMDVLKAGLDGIEAFLAG